MQHKSRDKTNKGKREKMQSAKNLEHTLSFFLCLLKIKKQTDCMSLAVYPTYTFYFTSLRAIKHQ